MRRPKRLAALAALLALTFCSSALAARNPVSKTEVETRVGELTNAVKPKALKYTSGEPTAGQCVKWESATAFGGGSCGGGSLPEWLTGKNEVSCSAGKAKLNYEKYAYYIVKTSEACTLEPEKIGATELQPMTIKLEITGTHTVKLPAEAIWIGGEPALNAAGSYYFSVTVVGESGKSSVATPSHIIGQGEVGSSSCTVPSESVASGSLLYKTEATGCKSKWEAKPKYHRIESRTWDYIGEIPAEGKSLGGFFVLNYPTGTAETKTLATMKCKTKEKKVKLKVFNEGEAVGGLEAEYEPTAKEKTATSHTSLANGNFVELVVQSAETGALNLYCTLFIEAVQSE